MDEEIREYIDKNVVLPMRELRKDLSEKIDSVHIAVVTQNGRIRANESNIGRLEEVVTTQVTLLAGQTGRLDVVQALATERAGVAAQRFQESRNRARQEHSETREERRDIYSKLGAAAPWVALATAFISAAGTIAAAVALSGGGVP